jgi:uncharacterized protein (DUF58 family)
MLMVKEFEQDPQADVWILLDALQGVHLALPYEPLDQKAPEQLWILPRKIDVPLPPDSFEYSVSAAASIANYYILEGRSVGFASYGKHLSITPAERGERQLGKILEICAFLRPEGTLPRSVDWTGLPVRLGRRSPRQLWIHCWRWIFCCRPAGGRVDVPGSRRLGPKDRRAYPAVLFRQRDHRDDLLKIAGKLAVILQRSKRGQMRQLAADFSVATFGLDQFFTLTCGAQAEIFQNLAGSFWAAW